MQYAYAFVDAPVRQCMPTRAHLHMHAFTRAGDWAGVDDNRAHFISALTTLMVEHAFWI